MSFYKLNVLYVWKLAQNKMTSVIFLITFEVRVGNYNEIYAGCTQNNVCVFGIKKKKTIYIFLLPHINISIDSKIHQH